MDTGMLFLNLFIGVIGLAYLTYGKKQQHSMALISGLGLSIFPFFVSNIWLTALLGVLFVVAPFVFEL